MTRLLRYQLDYNVPCSGSFRLFAICLIFPGFCLGDEVSLGAGRNCCGELMLGSEYVLVDDPEVESMSNLFVELCRFRVVCGQYCVAFLTLRCRNVSMHAFSRLFTTDLVANDCRVFDWLGVRNRK